MSSARMLAVIGGVVGAGALMSTRMACEPSLMEHERWLTEMLGSRPRRELSGLALHWGTGQRWWLGLERDAAAVSTP